MTGVQTCALPISRRKTGEPVQHITGRAPFRYETLDVGPGVFIPRPETELLVDEVLAHLAGLPAGRHRVVELCAGSGAITRSLARERGGLELHPHGGYGMAIRLFSWR